MNLKNTAKGGNSNYQIFFDFCENVDDINEGDIVLIGWALIGKFIVVDNDENNDLLEYYKNRKK